MIFGDDNVVVARIARQDDTESGAPFQVDLVGLRDGLATLLNCEAEIERGP